MRRITHIDGVPVRRPFYTYPAMTTHQVVGFWAWLSRLVRRIVGD